MHKILIVDDDEVILHLLSRALTGAGHQVFTTADGPQGVTIYKKEQPDLVLVDLGLPTMFGLDVLKEIRSFDKKANVIIITAYGSVRSAVAALRYGASDYIQKPVDMKVLLGKIEAALHVSHDH